MRGDTVQMQMIRRYARVLREKQSEFRGPRIGAREVRMAREAAQTARDAAESTVRGAVGAVRAERASPER